MKKRYGKVSMKNGATSCDNRFEELKREDIVYLWLKNTLEGFLLCTYM